MSDYRSAQASSEPTSHNDVLDDTLRRSSRIKKLELQEMASLIRQAPLVFPAAARHTATVIFVHGLGDTGYGWADAVENWRRRQRLDEVKFILPHAPSIRITCNMGMKMPGWYDIAEINGTPDSLRTNEDEPGILISRDYFHGLIQQELDAGIPAERIVLGGFSQGGAMSLFSGLTSKVKLGGIVALSSYLLLSLKFAEFLPTPNVNKDTPIFMGHGDQDNIVPIQLGVKSHDALKGHGYNPIFKIYPGMSHSACPREMNDVEDFLKDRLPALGKQEGHSEL